MSLLEISLEEAPLMPRKWLPSDLFLLDSLAGDRLQGTLILPWPPLVKQLLPFEIGLPFCSRLPALATIGSLIGMPVLKRSELGYMVTSFFPIEAVVFFFLDEMVFGSWRDDTEVSAEQ